MDLAIISDTHLPRGRRELPAACLQRLAAADLILHAGDFVAIEVLRQLEALGPPVAGVWGNVDSVEIYEALPETRVIEADGVRIGMIHDSGPSKGRLERMRARFPEADAVVFGHSHIPLHVATRDDFQLFNPGSPTDRRRQPRHTMGVGRVADGRVKLELVALD